MHQPINFPPETTRECVAGRIIHVGEGVMNWKGSRECAVLSVALWEGWGVCRNYHSHALWSIFVRERRLPLILILLFRLCSHTVTLDTFTGLWHHYWRSHCWAEDFLQRLKTKWGRGFSVTPALLLCFVEQKTSLCFTKIKMNNIKLFLYL